MSELYNGYKQPYRVYISVGEYSSDQQRGFEKLTAAIVAQAIKDILRYPSPDMAPIQKEAFRFLKTKWADLLSNGAAIAWYKLIEKDYDLARLIWIQSGIISIVRAACGLDEVTKRKQTSALSKLACMDVNDLNKRRFVKIWQYLVFNDMNTAIDILRRKDYKSLYRYRENAYKYVKSKKFAEVKEKLGEYMTKRSLIYEV